MKNVKRAVLFASLLLAAVQGMWAQTTTVTNASELTAAVQTVQSYCDTWARMKPYVGRRVHAEVAALLQQNLAYATWWRDACIDYFSTFTSH